MIELERTSQSLKDNSKFYLVVYIAIFLAGLYSGAYFLRLGILGTVKHHLLSLSYDPPAYLKYTISTPDNDFPKMNLNINFKDYIKISNQRSRFIYSPRHFVKGYQWTERDEIYAKCKIKYKEEKYKSKLKLFGLNNDHFRHPYKWSFRVKTKEFIKDIRNEKFNLLQANTRFYISDILCNKVFEKFGLIDLEYTPVNLKINNFRRDIYLIEDFFTKYLIEKNDRRESFLFSADDINHPSQKKITSSQLSDLEEIKRQMIEQPEKVINKEAFDVFIALTFIAQNKHATSNDNLHLYYNPVNSRVEPIIREIWFEHPINVSSEEDLKNQIFQFIDTYLIASNRLLKKHYSLYTIDSKHLEGLCKTVNLVAHTMKGILSDPEWKEFENIIFSRYPEALFLCGNIFKNINQITDLKIKTAYVLEKENEVITINENTTLEGDLHLIDKDLIITNGTSINLNGYNIIVEKGKLIAKGNANNPINLFNESKNPSSVLVLEPKDTCHLRNVNFSNLSNFNKSYWHLPSAVTFYKAVVFIENANFYANKKGDDYLNVFGCPYFEVNNVNFSDVLADAIDSDFSNGKVTNAKFSCIGNDAVDGSGSVIEITNSSFSDVQDKVISSGERSNFTVNSCEIKNSEIAFVSKDGSQLKETNNELSMNSLDYCLFNKKEEFGNGTLFTDKNLERFTLLLEPLSTVYFNNKIQPQFKRTEKVKDKLYGKEYGEKSIR